MANDSNNEVARKHADATQDRACERCGQPKALFLAGHWYCLECYNICCSCCLEFGADDIWAERNDLDG